VQDAFTVACLSQYDTADVLSFLILSDATYDAFTVACLSQYDTADVLSFLILSDATY